MRLKPGKSGASPARLQCQRVHPPEEPHPPNLHNLSRVDIGQYGTESTARAGCALVEGFCFSRVAAPLIFERLWPSTKEGFVYTEN
jgi:hypothetical protein